MSQRHVWLALLSSRYFQLANNSLSANHLELFDAPSLTTTFVLEFFTLLLVGLIAFFPLGSDVRVGPLRFL